MKKGNRIIALLSVCTSPILLHAQISGKVVDSAGEALPAAYVFWKNTGTGVTTDEEGLFSIDKSEKTDSLVIRYVGYEAYNISVNSEKKNLGTIKLKELDMTQEVEVIGNRMSTIKSRGLMNETNITSMELTRAACCNLGESFTTNPSVDVNYSDAATGAKQIKLLGLSGNYVQMLTENIPNFRGASEPYALGYVPGPWMQSIQVSKGAASVKNGYESITGQINIEFKKPQTDQQISANVYGDTKSRIEANADANWHINKKLSTGLLAHFENTWTEHDENDDGIIDKPKIRQFNIMNRWAWFGNNYIFQGGIKVLNEKRIGGQTSHGMSGNEVNGMERYKININTERYEAFAKNAYIFNQEHNSNIALILSGSLHNQDATFGHKAYDVNEKNLYASLMFESNLTDIHSISAGLSLNHDYYGQTYRINADQTLPYTDDTEKETVSGAYAQYTLNLNDKFTAMAGIRADYSSEYGTFVTPRFHVKYAPAEWFNLRASAGKGYRTVHALAEYHYLLASGRTLVIDDLKQEEAWNYGVSTSFYIPLFGKTLNLNAEYYYTDFKNQTVIDYDTNAENLYISNLSGKSYSHTLQIDATYPVFSGFNLTAAFRLNDVKCTYNGKLREKPLTSKYKGLITASYKTPLELWQFDVTLQLNGGGRMPDPYQYDDGTYSWNSRFSAYEQLNAQITRLFRYWSIYIGGENLTGFKQKNPIIAADSPWSSKFEPTMIWGPVHGAMFYAGIRLDFNT